MLFFIFIPFLPLDVVVVPERSRFFLFLPFLFFLSFYVCCYQPVISTHGCHLQISSLHHKSPRNNFSSAHLSGGRRKKNKKNNLMSELIKACRSCICCTVYMLCERSGCWPLLFLSFPLLEEKKEKENVSYINFFTPCPRKKKSACIQAAGLESNRKGKTLEK